MSASLLWCVLVLGIGVSAAIINRNVADLTPKIANQTWLQEGPGFFIQNPNRRIVIEEVDKHGNSIVKELELPDYNDSGEQQRVKQRKSSASSSGGSKGEDFYGCDKRRESQRKKCLQRQKKFIKGRYKNWKTLIRQIIKDLDGKIKMIGQDGKKRTTTANLKFSGFSPKKVMRNKD